MENLDAIVKLCKSIKYKYIIQLQISKNFNVLLIKEAKIFKVIFGRRFLNNASYPIYAAATQEHIFLIFNLISNYMFSGLQPL